jgi:aspartate kinase
VAHRNSDANNSSVHVLKFGGSSFVSPEAYHVVARHLAKRATKGEHLCVVVSAMSGTTGRLSELLHLIAPSPETQDVDAVLGTGEILASALVRAALSAHRVGSTSLNGFQLGWRASGDFRVGRLTDFPATVIADALRRGPIVVISGGQATTEENRLIMLGRNSSDLTAVAVAVAMRCPTVTMYSDVEGVFTADPYLLANTSLIPRLGYQQAQAYSQWGAKVLHSGCIELAQRHQVRIQCASLTSDGRTLLGTEITEVGRGVQVCLPNNLVICRVLGNACGATDASRLASELFAVAARPDHYAATPNSRYKELTAAGVVVTVDELAPVASFSLEGALQIHAVPKTERLTRAQEIHDFLVQDMSFPKQHRQLLKQRGSHSGVYSDLSQKIST